jgi:hypothetical protein
MTSRSPEDTDATAEEEALEFDGTQTVQLDDTYRVRVVSASENGNGVVDHDDRGQARWKWSTEASDPAMADTGTFDLIKSPDNDALSVTADVPALPSPSVDKEAGYNPYGAIAEETPPKGFSKTKRNVKLP